jgi:hypothetical protein
LCVCCGDEPAVTRASDSMAFATAGDGACRPRPGGERGATEAPAVAVLAGDAAAEVGVLTAAGPALALGTLRLVVPAPTGLVTAAAAAALAAVDDAAPADVRPALLGVREGALPGNRAEPALVLWLAGL